MKKIYLTKAKNQIARHSTIRDINRRIVLNYVRVRSPISRAEIARETSLQRSTVSAIVDDLIGEGLVEDIGAGDSTGGRKPTLLRLKQGTPVAIGVDVTPRETTVVLADLIGDVLQKETFPTSPDIDFMNQQIISKVAALAEANSAYDLEVGISIPGIADQRAGDILYIPYFQWSHWDIGRALADRAGLNVIIENDANAVALAELWFGSPEIRRTRNFILVMVAEGIGTGIVIDGDVYRGEHGAAGEFGHMYVAPSAPVACSCGRFDCWEAHASEKACVGRYASRLNGGRSAPVDMDHVIDLALSGEPMASACLKETAGYLGVGISSLLIGFSPQAIVVSGKIVRAWDLIEDAIQESGQRSIRQEVAGASIIPSSLGDQPTIQGSISLVLAKRFGAAGWNFSSASAISA